MLQSAVKALDPDAVVILLGTNDVLSSDEKEFADNLTAFVQRVQKATDAPVMIMSHFRIFREYGVTKDYLSYSYPAVRDRTGCTYWNMYAWYGDGVATLKDSSDGVHCNAAAGKRIAAELYAQVRAMRLPAAGDHCADKGARQHDQTGKHDEACAYDKTCGNDRAGCPGRHNCFGDRRYDRCRHAGNVGDGDGGDKGDGSRLGGDKGAGDVGAADGKGRLPRLGERADRCGCPGGRRRGGGADRQEKENGQRIIPVRKRRNADGFSRKTAACRTDPFGGSASGRMCRSRRRNGAVRIGGGIGRRDGGGV